MEIVGEIRKNASRPRSPHHKGSTGEGGRERERERRERDMEAERGKTHSYCLISIKPECDSHYKHLLRGCKG